MRTFFTFLAGAGLALSLTTAYAAEGAAPATPAKAPTAQQSKMATCNTEAGDKKGDERKAFMKQCLGATSGANQAGASPAASNKQLAQQEKMKTCNADAKTKALKGDERKAFMKECLSNKG